MSEFHDISYNKSFSQLAKESSFTFNLYRGRVDWRKLEELDVDRVVRDQDVELLHLYLNSVTNCSLESEYDVKILDPNFIKLFRLAQLLIDFLLHCKKYLEHCIKVAHESLQTSNKEVEALRKLLQARRVEVKKLKKKFKDVKQQMLYSPGGVEQTFECSLCGKVFMSETFLHGHHSRRHQPSPYSLVLRPLNVAPTSPHVKIVASEREEKVVKTEEVANVKKKYQEEIEDLKKLFFTEIEKLKHNENVQKATSNIQTQYSRDDEKDKLTESKQDQPKGNEAFKNTLDKNENQNPQVSLKGADIDSESENVKKTDEKEAEEEWVKRLEEREHVWRGRLSALDQQHKKQVQQLQDKLNSTQLQGQEMKKELELRLEEVLAKFEQSQKILANKQESLHNQNNKEETPKDELKIQDEIIQIKIQTDEIVHSVNVKQPPPFQKRKAFVSQKTKTIQDSFDIPNDKELQENLVQVLNPDDDSELENVSTLTQNSTREKEKISAEIKTPVNVDDKNIEISRSKNKESIIAKLLEEERLRSLGDVKRKVVETEGESTLSGSVTDTETESGEERGGLHSSDDQDQLLQEESQLAQQSLQSMEALLAANPGILQQLRSDLAELAGRRLQSLGVDPAWRGLPEATYRDKVATLTHQRNITAKNHPVYFTLRDKLRKDADSAVAVRSKAEPRSSAAESLLRRLRSKAAQVISAARFTRGLGSGKRLESLSQQNTSQLRDSKPLAASSPQLTPDSTKLFELNQVKNSPATTKVQSAGESFSLSSSTEEEDEEVEKDETPRKTQVLHRVEETATHNVDKAFSSIALHKDEATTSPASFKSALRHSVSTTNITKKKVLFVDEAFNDSKRSQSENAVVARQNLNTPSRLSGNESVASLVEEIQQQLSNRSGKPSFSVDLMNKSGQEVKTPEIPLGEILPLTKSGRELLDSPSKSSRTVPSKSAFLELSSPRLLEPLSQALQKVPTPKGTLSSLGKKPDLLDWSSKSTLFPPKLSPDLSVSSLGSSLLDLSASPRTTRRPPRGSLEWDLQDLEDNMKD